MIFIISNNFTNNDLKLKIKYIKCFFMETLPEILYNYKLFFQYYKNNQNI